MNEQVRRAAERLRGELEFTDFSTDPRAVDLTLVLDAVQTGEQRSPSLRACPSVPPERETEPLRAKDGSLDHLLDSDALARFKEFLDEILALGIPETESTSVRTAYLHALVTALVRERQAREQEDREYALLRDECDQAQAVALAACEARLAEAAIYWQKTHDRLCTIGSGACSRHQPLLGWLDVRMRKAQSAALAEKGEG